MYGLISLEDSEYSKDDFDSLYVKKIQFGYEGFYYVLKNGDPFLRVEVDIRSLFDDAIIFNEYLCIGSRDSVYFINMDNLECKEIEVQMYFGYFHIYNDLLFVLDGQGVIAFDNKIHELWRQTDLAIDGVVLEEIENDTVLVLSCEMDPPGGWVTRKINILNGMEI